MKRELNKLMIAMLFIAGFMFLIPANESCAQDWKAPASYKSKVNKYKHSKDADGVGKELWNQHCASCHGKEGYGDGKKADQLDTEIPEFASAAFQKQTDGEIYYKSFIGRDEMPNFTKKITSEQDRWLLVNYIRTLNK